MAAWMPVVLIADVVQRWSNIEAVVGGTFPVFRRHGSPESVLEFCQTIAPCIAVASPAFLNQVDPTELVNIVDGGHSIRVLVVLDDARADQAARFVRIGCSGYLPDGTSPEQAVQALHAVMSGEIWGSRAVLSQVLRTLLRESTHHLTSRESAILELLAEGLKNHEIAERLFISPQTVRWHLRSLYGKLGTHDRLQAIFRTSVGEPIDGSCPKRPVSSVTRRTLYRSAGR